VVSEPLLPRDGESSSVLSALMNYKSVLTIVILSSQNDNDSDFSLASSLNLQNLVVGGSSSASSLINTSGRDSYFS